MATPINMGGTAGGINPAPAMPHVTPPNPHPAPLPPIAGGKPLPDDKRPAPPTTPHRNAPR